MQTMQRTWIWIPVPTLDHPPRPSCMRHLLLCALLFCLATSFMWLRCINNRDHKWGTVAGYRHGHPRRLPPRGNSGSAWRVQGTDSMSNRARRIRDSIRLYQSLDSASASSATSKSAERPFEGTIALAVVVCNTAGAGSTARGLPSWGSKQLRQLKVMIKSLLLTEGQGQATRLQGPGPTLELNVFTDNPLIFAEVEHFVQSSGELHSDYTRRLVLKHRIVSYPKEFEYLKYLLWPCATYRLFLPSALPQYDSIVYLDTDVIFFQSVHDLYTELRTFNDTQWVAMGPDSYHTRPKEVRIPFYGAQGANSGVGVYNLTRMRSSALLAKLHGIYKQYRDRIGNAGDQDVLNIYFAERPQELKLLTCEQNYIAYFCGPTPLCTHPGGHGCGIAILHGSSGAFFQPTIRSQFAIIFEEFEQLNMNATISALELSAFYANLKARLVANQYGNGNQPTTKPDVAGDAEGGWEGWFETVCTKNSEFIDNLFRNISISTMHKYGTM